MESRGDLERAWRAIRDNEVASGSRRAKNAAQNSRTLERWRTMTFAEFRAILRNPLGLPADVTSLTAEGLRAWKTRRKVVAKERKMVRKAIEAARLAEKARRNERVQAARDRRAAILLDEEARLAELRKAAPRLPAGSKPPPPKAATTKMSLCPHGMERSNCAYCSRGRR